MTDSNRTTGRWGTGTMLSRLTPPIIDDRRRTANRDGNPTGIRRAADCARPARRKTPAHKGFRATTRRVPRSRRRPGLSNGYSGPYPRPARWLSQRHTGRTSRQWKETRTMSNLRRRLVATSALVTALAGGALMFASPAFAGPSNDNFAGAANLVGAAGQFVPSLNNSTATAEPGEPAHFVSNSTLVDAR